MDALTKTKTTSQSLGIVWQVALAVTILLAAFGVHKTLAWQETTTLPSLVQRSIPLKEDEMNLVRNAWHYFQKNRLPNGLVSSAASFPSTNMWDVGSQFAGMVAAREVGLLSSAEFDKWMGQALASLAQLPLYRGELPNKAYNAATLTPINYGQLEKREEIGFLALDLGRLVRWLDIVAARYPQHAAASRAVTDRWKRDRLVSNGQLMSTDARNGKETWSQEGRLGYEQYAAYGLSKIKVSAPKALDPKAETTEVKVYDVSLPVDKRDTHNSEAHNYVTSEPYVLDGLESGFKALPVDFAGRLLQAQQRRYQATKQLTAWSEENLDKAPWFVYNSIFVDGQPWKTIDESGKDSAALRGSSVKAAVGWHVLFRTAYTERLYKGMRWLADPNQAVFAGFYEETQQPNRAITVNTNGIILEGLLYSKVGRPLEVWAHEKH
jgi:hypothetical protein